MKIAGALALALLACDVDALLGRPALQATRLAPGRSVRMQVFEGYEQKLDAKSALLSAIESGVGKNYFLTSRAAAAEIKKAVADLEATGADLPVKYPSDFATLDGRWKLVYSSNILGVGRLSPLLLDSVYQLCDTAGNSIKNIVYGTVAPPLFETTWGRFPVAAIANAAKRVNERVSLKVDFSLDHTFEITSSEYPAQLKIALREVKLLNCEKPEQRSLAVPAIRPLAQVSAGKFDTTYMDDDLRISRGNFGEVRVFQRSTDSPPSSYADDAGTTVDSSDYM